MTIYGRLCGRYHDHIWRSMWKVNLVVCLEVVNLLVECMVPELLADKDHSIQFILEPRCVP